MQFDTHASVRHHSDAQSQSFFYLNDFNNMFGSAFVTGAAKKAANRFIAHSMSVEYLAGLFVGENEIVVEDGLAGSIADGVSLGAAAALEVPHADGQQQRLVGGLRAGWADFSEISWLQAFSDLLGDTTHVIRLHLGSLDRNEFQFQRLELAEGFHRDGAKFQSR